MHILIQCVACQQPLKLRNELLGRMVYCPACQTHFLAEATPAATPLEPISTADGGHESEEPHRQLFREVPEDADGDRPPARTDAPERKPDDRRRLKLVALAVALFLVCGVVIGVLRTFLRRADDWQSFAPAEGGFRIDFPAAPEARKQRGATMYFTQTVRPRLEYAVQHVAIPDIGLGENPQAALRVLAEAMAGELAGRVARERSIRLGSQAGLEVEIHADGNRRYRLVRCFVTSKRMYAVHCTSRKPETLEHENVARFLDSFRLAE
jgi:hypothetical protein